MLWSVENFGVDLLFKLYALLTADGEESARLLEGLDDVELQPATATEFK